MGSSSEVISFIRGLRDIKRTPILAITSQSDPEVRIRALEEGVDDILEKPFGMPHIRDFSSGKFLNFKYLSNNTFS